ncbi:ZW10 interactor isoform X2 [Ambystoma mexicanum]|uniref:ZW10 interactor isoform X2 n=1 Tax=Ambystoma mexicanum TaxID=8296 RepID=UPI0037E92BF2
MQDQGLLHPRHVNCVLKQNTKLRQQKILLQQLNAVKLLLDYTVQCDANIQAEKGLLETPRKELNAMKKQWKFLKEEYLEQVEKIELSILQLLDKLEQLRSKKGRLEEVLQLYQDKVEEIKTFQQQQVEENVKLAGCVEEGRQRVQMCEKQIQRLQTELQRHQARGEMWMENLKKDSDLLQLVEGLCGIRLVLVDEQQMIVDVQDPCSGLGHSEGKPLGMTLHWTNDETFQILTDSAFVIPADVLLEEQNTAAKMAILEIQNAYRSQARLLQELEEMKSKFPIDWRPKERKLLYLKGSTVCVLLIEPGYPSSGRIQLLALQGYKGSMDICLLKPPYASPTLCNWLVYLASNPEI